MDVDVSHLFDVAGVPLELIGRVDQAWAQAVGGGSREVSQYVKATEAVVGAVVTGCRRMNNASGMEAGEVVGHLLARVVTVPLTEPTAQAGQAIAKATVVNYMGGSLGHQIDRIYGMPHSAPTMEPALAPSAEDGPEVADPTKLLLAIANIISVESPVSPLHKIRRVLRPDSEEVLASWLRTTRPTIRAWEHDGVPRGGERSRRLRTVESIADLLDEYLDPTEIARYVHDNPIEAIGGRTLAQLLADADTDDLIETLDGLTGALVW